MPYAESRWEPLDIRVLKKYMFTLSRHFLWRLHQRRIWYRDDQFESMLLSCRVYIPEQDDDEAIFLRNKDNAVFVLVPETATFKTVYLVRERVHARHREDVFVEPSELRFRDWILLREEPSPVVLFWRRKEGANYKIWPYARSLRSGRTLKLNGGESLYQTEYNTFVSRLTTSLDRIGIDWSISDEKHDLTD